MVEVVKYSAEHKPLWDAFVRESKNGTFMLLRDYMEYHADRFTDHSLLFYHKGRLVALLPANEAGEQVQSHGGLSYAGLVTDKRMKAALMLEVVQAMKLYFQGQWFRSILYKAIPHIYHQQPAEEDLYALFRHGAILYRRDVNSVAALAAGAGYSRTRRWEIRKAKGGSIQVQLSMAYTDFMQLEWQVLQQKYNLKPVHTAAEVELLASRFPENIRLYTATKEGELLAGTLVFETATVAHCQYIASSEQGKQAGALDVLLDWLLTEVYAHKPYFSFGVSTEQGGQYLNEGLVWNKESYGARTIVHDFYELRLQ
ncbi:acetyltransferase (GNAT) family protein [Pontibacter mucosus]|uniref:Acetyltransferase (GNAT) family protein n=1 Tax=Pontibacter mucosus TaxID=1649266 RepID=A0A2T5YSM2_9BACT|nr:GNAT family N-acetyltransferase [Pontibacter mucosus]PTX22310.1 acetyltransferase (GNAT) family protein [Pontibacter mucosus]